MPETFSGHPPCICRAACPPDRLATQILVFSRCGKFTTTEKANGHAPHRLGFAAKPCVCVRVGAQCNPFAEEKKRRSLLPRRTFSAVSPTRLAGGLSQRILVDHPPRYLAMWPPYAPLLLLPQLLGSQDSSVLKARGPPWPPYLATWPTYFSRGLLSR